MGLGPFNFVNSKWNEGWTKQEWEEVVVAYYSHSMGWTQEHHEKHQSCYLPYTCRHVTVSANMFSTVSAKLTYESCSGSTIMFPKLAVLFHWILVQKLSNSVYCTIDWWHENYIWFLGYVPYPQFNSGQTQNFHKILTTISFTA